LCTANFSGPLGQQQARFGGQQAGSRPSWTVLSCRCVVVSESCVVPGSALSCRCVVVGELCEVPGCWIWPLLIDSWRR
jgi:hypothetical protein